MKEFNVNECVMIKLTEVGIAELKKQHDELVAIFPNCGKFEPKKVDDDGFSKWQLHSVMSTFGHLMHLGFDLPFETTIRFES